MIYIEFRHAGGFSMSDDEFAVYDADVTFIEQTNEWINVTLDDPDVRYLAKRDPALFMLSD